MRHAPFSTIGPLDSDAMDTANAHNDTIDEASDILEQEPTAEATTEEQPTEEAGIDSSESPSWDALRPPRNPRWTDRLNTPAAGWVATAIAAIVAAIIRLPGLDNVRTLIFDETYYVTRGRGPRTSTPLSSTATPLACQRLADTPSTLPRENGSSLWA